MRSWSEGGKELAAELKAVIEEHDADIEKWRDKVIALEALFVGTSTLGVLADRLKAMDAKIEGATKTLAGLLGKAEAMGIAHPEALMQIRDFVAEKKREEARADGERAG